MNKENKEKQKSEKMSKNDSQKIMVDPWGNSLIEDYSRLIREFGMQEFDLSIMPNPNAQMRRGVIFGGQDLKIIAEAIKTKKNFIV